jgi:hypothetical protein
MYISDSPCSEPLLGNLSVTGIFQQLGIPMALSNVSTSKTASVFEWVEAGGDTRSAGGLASTISSQSRHDQIRYGHYSQMSKPAVAGAHWRV